MRRKNAQNCAKKCAKKNCADCAKANGKSQKKKAVSDALLIEGDTKKFRSAPMNSVFLTSRQNSHVGCSGEKADRGIPTGWLWGQGATANSNASRMLRNARVYRLSATSAISTRNAIPQTWIYCEPVDGHCPGRPQSVGTISPVNCRYCWGENHLYQWRDIADSIRLRHRPPEMVNPSRNMEARLCW